MILLAFASVLLLGWSWFLDKKRRLFWLVLAVALVQALVSGGLYFLSIHPPELLKSKVLGPGFWVPFGDAENYFEKSGKILTQGISYAAEHPPSSLYVMLLALVSWDSSEPILSALWMNGLFHLILLPITYIVTCRLGEDIALWAAIGVGGLPTSLLYSAQLLRDPLIWMLLVGVIALLLLFEEKNKKQGDCQILIGLCLGGAFLTEMRPWWGYVLGSSLLLAFWSGKKVLLSTKNIAVVFSVFLGICLGNLNPASTLMKSLPEGEFLLRGIKFQEHKKTLIIPKKEQKNKKTIQSQNRFLNNLYEAALIRVKDKWDTIKNQPPIFFILLFFFDISFLIAWLRNIQTLKIKSNFNLFSQQSYEKILGFMIILLGGITLIFADSFGNLTRYATPALLLSFIFLARKTARKLIQLELRK